jgi:hypothetical protein
VAGRGIKRGLAIAGCLVGVILISAGLAWLFTDALFGNLGGVGDDISAGVDGATLANGALNRSPPSARSRANESATC